MEDELQKVAKKIQPGDVLTVFEYFRKLVRFSKIGFI